MTHRTDKMMRRALADLLLLASVLYFPWWVMPLLGGSFSFFFPDYYELIVAALLTDILYGGPLPYLGRFPLPYTAGALVLFILLTLVRRRMRI